MIVMPDSDPRDGFYFLSTLTPTINSYYIPACQIENFILAHQIRKSWINPGIEILILPGLSYPG